jgi:thiamine biosynthesis lipoprotein
MSTPVAVLDGPGVCEWSVWTTTARLVVSDPTVLNHARAATVEHLAAVDAAASRFRPDSEVSRLAAGDGRPTVISPLLADLVATALSAATRTDGAVDPTVGRALAALGYDRDLADVTVITTRNAVVDIQRPAARRPASWRAIHLDGRVLTMPAGTLLDLGATAKARAADHCAALVKRRFGCGVLVSLGGDLRVAGPPPDGHDHSPDDDHDHEPAAGWEILVQDGPGEPASRLRLSGAEAVATSSTLHRRWRGGSPVRGPQLLHHIVDPATLRPAASLWRTVSVAAATCVDANTLTTAALARPTRARLLLEAAGLPARLVAADGHVTRLGGWPA